MFAIFRDYPGLIASLSTKSDGPMGLAYDGGAEKRRGAFLGGLGINPERAVAAHLIHGNVVGVVGKESVGRVVQNVDGLATDARNLFLEITVADCLPIFYFDPGHGALAIAHAGWRGLAQEMPKMALRKMRESFGSDPADVLIAIGPHVCARHYGVQADVADRFMKNESGSVLRQGGALFLDLAQAAKTQLLWEGAQEKNIEVSAECTFELDEKYYSYRRDKPERIATMMAVIGLKL